MCIQGNATVAKSSCPCGTPKDFLEVAHAQESHRSPQHLGQPPAMARSTNRHLSPSAAFLLCPPRPAGTLELDRFYQGLCGFYALPHLFLWDNAGCSTRSSPGGGIVPKVAVLHWHTPLCGTYKLGRAVWRYLSSLYWGIFCLAFSQGSGCDNFHYNGNAALPPAMELCRTTQCCLRPRGR